MVGDNPENIADNADVAKAAADAIKSLTESTEASADKINIFNNFSIQTGNILTQNGNIVTKLASTFTNLASSMNASHMALDKQSQVIGLVGSAFIKMNDSFSHFNVPTDNLNTFTDQIQYFTANIKDSGVLTQKLSEIAENVFGKVVPDSIKGSVGGVKQFVLDLAANADAALRVQNAFINLSGQTGNLGRVYDAAGPNLENMNALIEKQMGLMVDAGKANLGEDSKTIESYYSSLGSIPGALESVVKTGNSTGETMSTLAASIKLATGLGLSQKDMLDGLTTAYKDYNLVGEPALKFTAQISELSNKFGINLSAVRDELTKTASTFRMYGNEAEGAAKMTNRYLDALKDTGLSGEAKVDLINQMTEGISHLTIAQKAFLSAQTGGPGGLMGGFQIEKLLADGHLDQVMEKVRMQMQKQFGKIVSVDEAANSPQAAAQLTKQRAIIQQGPLGQFARDEQSAQRILEGFRAIQDGKSKPQDLATNIVQNSVDKGTKIQEKSFTELARIRATLEEMKALTAKGSLDQVQAMATASKGNRGIDTPAQAAMRKGLTGSMEKATAQSGKNALNLKNQINAKAVQDETTSRFAELGNDFKSILGDIPIAAKSAIDGVKSTIMKAQSGKAKESDFKKSYKELNDLEEKSSDLPKEKRKSLLEYISKMKNALTNARYDEMSPIKSSGVDFTSRAKQAMGPSKSPAMGTINKTAASTPTKTEATVSGGQNKAGAGKLGEIMVHVTGYCIKCKREIEGSDQAMSINPASSAT